MGKWRRQLAVAVSVGLVGGAVVLGTAPVARADSLSEDFESLAHGSPHGQKRREVNRY